MHLLLIKIKRSEGTNDFVLFSGESVDSPETGSTAGVSEAPPAVIPSQGDLLGDLLNLDLTPPATAPAPTSGLQMGAVDLLGAGLDSLVGLSHAGVGQFHAALNR